MHWTTDEENFGRTQIDALYRKSGYLSLPYHFVVKRDGTIQCGRPIEKAGKVDHQHAASSINVCIVLPPDSTGTGELARYTPEQKQSTEGLLQQIKKQYVPINMEVLMPVKEVR